MKAFAARESWSRLFVGGILTATLLLLAALPARADLPGAHPNYIRSRSDLRRAEALLRYTDAPDVVRKLEHSAENIHQAIGELDRAIALDGKPEEANPPVDVPNLARASRFLEIERLLNGALKDLAMPEDNHEAFESRRLASEHIRASLTEVQQAATIFREDHAAPPPPPVIVTERHPHYLKALSDLRFARALLERHEMEGAPWRISEREGAIAEIDRSLAEIKRAALDDGKNLNDHPTVDLALPLHNRMIRVIELLDSTERDLAFEEDDQAALGWRAAARHHVAEARRMVDATLH